MKKLTTAGRLLILSATAFMLLQGSSLAAENPVTTADSESQTNESAADKKELIQRAAKARDHNAKQLMSAFGSGRVQVSVHESGEKEAVRVLDADVQVFFDRPKYHVHLVFDQKLNESVRVPGQLEEDFQRWKPSDLAEQVVIYDGEQIISIEVLKDGTVEGTLYFGFAKMAVMRNAGFPFEDPISLWTQALHLEGLDLKSTNLTELERGGLLGQLNKNTYRMKFFILDKFGYDLRRVSSYRIGETQPFRDYLLNWENSNGVFYVQRFINAVTSAGRDTGSSSPTVRKLSVEFRQFEANIDLAPDVFSIDCLNLPDGTLFFDKRSTVEGGPKQLLFRSGALVDPNRVEASGDTKPENHG